MNLLNQINEKKDELSQKIKEKLREKALLRAKARLAENKIDINELSEDELEIIVKDEEDKLLDDLKTKSILGLAALLGISFFWKRLKIQ